MSNTDTPYSPDSAREEGQVTQSDLNHLIGLVQNVLNDYAAKVEAHIRDLEGRVEQYEKVNAVLAAAFAEVGSIVDSIFDTVMEQLDDEGKDRLTEAIEMRRREMFESLQNTHGLFDGDTDAFTAMGNMAEPDEAGEGEE